MACSHSHATPLECVCSWSPLYIRTYVMFTSVTWTYVWILSPSLPLSLLHLPPFPVLCLLPPLSLPPPSFRLPRSLLPPSFPLSSAFSVSSLSLSLAPSSSLCRLPTIGATPTVSGQRRYQSEWYKGIAAQKEASYNYNRANSSFLWTVPPVGPVTWAAAPLVGTRELNGLLLNTYHHVGCTYVCMYVCVLFECYTYSHGHGCLVYTTLLWCAGWIGNCVQWLPCQLSCIQ